MKKIEVKMFYENTAGLINTVYPCFAIQNSGDEVINLSDIKVRYYCIIEGDGLDYLWCTWSNIGAENISGVFVKMNSQWESAGHYLEIGFNSEAGIIKVGETVEIKYGFARQTWNNFNRTNSCLNSNHDINFTEPDKAAGYINGQLVCGMEPYCSIEYDRNPIKIIMHKSTDVKITNTIFPRFNIQNTGNSIIELSEIKARYYYNAGSQEKQSFCCDWSDRRGSNVVGAIVKISSSGARSKYFLEIGFKPSAGILSPGESVEVHSRIINQCGGTCMKENSLLYDRTKPTKPHMAI